MTDTESLTNKPQEVSEILPSAPYGWVGFHQPANEQPERQDPNRWGIPEEIFWEHELGATVRRAAWVMANRPDITTEELTRVMALRDDEIAEAKEFVRYEEAQNAYYLSPDDDPEHPKVYYKFRAGEMKGLSPEILRVWTGPEIADRIITLVDDRLKFSAPDTEGELFIFWRQPANAEADELELDAAWFPQRGAA